MGRNLTKEEFTAERYRALYNDIPSMYFTIDAEGTVLMVNTFGASQLGYEVDDLIGQPVLKVIHEAHHSEALNHVSSCIAARGKLRSWRFRKVRKDGSVLWVQEHARAVEMEDGETNILIVCEDITERMKLESQLLQSQKLKSIGVLAGGIAHDFNNLLTGILGNTTIAIHDVQPSSRAHERLQCVERAARRAADLCHQLLAYSGQGQFIVQPLDLNDIVREIPQLLEVCISKHVTLSYQLMDNAPAIEADATQIRQILMNMITNASDAIGQDQGTIGIATGVYFCSRPYLQETLLGAEAEEGTRVYIEVRDTGYGMDSETLNQIFDPFFTTKLTGRGLGLAAVLGIVRSHGGCIHIDSAPGKGTAFRILFPPSTLKPAAKMESPQPAETLGSSGTVLVVDDEDEVREMTCMILEDSGFTILSARDGEEALQRVSEHPNEINLILLDMVMPRLDGRATFRALRAMDEARDIPVLLFSGYTEQVAANRFPGQGLAGFLQKPFLPDELLTKVRETIVPQ